MFITDIIELARLAKQIKKDANLDTANAKTAAACWSKAKAISAQASKYVMEYPVACSANISDYKKALAIAKQVEMDCARFVILASGLNPIVDRKNGDTIEAHLNSLVSSFESYSDVPCTIEPATAEFINAGKEYMNKYFSSELYHTYKKDDIYSDNLDKSSEAIGTVNAFDDEGDDENITSYDLNGNPVGNDYDSMFKNIARGIGKERISPVATFEKPTEQNFKDLYYNMTGQELRSPEELEKEGMNIDEAKAQYDAAFSKYSKIMEQSRIATAAAHAQDNADILKKLNSVGPTIVTITLYLTDGAGGQRAIQLPLAIKSSLQFVDSEDLARVLKGNDSKNKFLTNLIKVTTGQMSFFKDWLAAISEADKDVERMKRLGNVPIFRRLLDAKNRYRLKSIAETKPILSKFIAGKTQKDLPMCTLICTSDELESIVNEKWTKIYKERKYINEIIDTFMLLGFGVVESTSDFIYIFYAGVPEPEIIDPNKIGGQSGSDVNKSLAEAISNTTRLLARR